MNNHLMNFEDIKNVTALFKKAVDAGASDVHLKVGSPAKMRKKDDLVPVPGYEGHVLTGEDTRLLVYATMSSANLARYENIVADNAGAAEYDYAFEIESVGRFRANAYKHRSFDGLVARLLRSRPQSLQELGINTAVSRLADSRNGIVLVTGYTGSGKSTTMAAMIDFINKSRPVNIISIENPIEILHEDALASISQREIGQDTNSFASALRAALRQDPDIILVGEIRDEETMEIALRAADTGHLVISTLHTTDTAEAFGRIFALYPPEKKESVRLALAASLRGIVGQRLAPSKDGGRLAVNEILINTPQVTEAILNSSPSHIIKSIIQKGEQGMQTFDQHLAKLYKEDKIELRIALEKADNPNELQALLGQVEREDGPKEVILPRLVLGDQLPPAIAQTTSARTPTQSSEPTLRMKPVVSSEPRKSDKPTGDAKIQQVIARPGQALKKSTNPLDLLDQE